METNPHNITNLFAQLGLPSSKEHIHAFIEANSPLDSQISLFDAPFWTQSQAKFLREEIIKDADWAVAIDKLNASLRE